MASLHIILVLYDELMLQGTTRGCCPACSSAATAQLLLLRAAVLPQNEARYKGMERQLDGAQRALDASQRQVSALQQELRACQEALQLQQ